MSGHIMTTAEVAKILTSENNRQIWFKVQDSQLMKYILYKGFIGIDGISLTVGEVTPTRFCVHLIPETLERTTLGKKKLGARVNIEIDPQTQAVVDTVERVLAARENAMNQPAQKPDLKSPWRGGDRIAFSEPLEGRFQHRVRTRPARAEYHGRGKHLHRHSDNR